MKLATKQTITQKLAQSVAFIKPDFSRDMEKKRRNLTQSLTLVGNGENSKLLSCKKRVPDPVKSQFTEQGRNLFLSFFYGYKIVSYRLGLIFFLVVGLCSCGSLPSSGLNGVNLKIGTNVTPIREIKPKLDNQAIVYIQGQVEKQAPLMKQWAYQINDSTGKIWVVTNQKNLAEGAQVVIKAKVRYRSIPLGGKELGEVYLEEE
ncbi:hypothetical protein [Nostoc sp.]|uniref:hypothetical protein n=1 Tax=Nostoc sp. TaxID=1180 RepID=UPI002FF94189